MAYNNNAWDDIVLALIVCIGVLGVVAGIVIASTTSINGTHQVEKTRAINARIVQVNSVNACKELQTEGDRLVCLMKVGVPNG